MFRGPCSKCGSLDHPRYYRKAHGKWGYASYCVICYREDQQMKNERWYAKPENRAKANAARNKIRKGNPKYQKIARDSYQRHRLKRLAQKSAKYVPVDPTKDKRRKFSLVGKIYEGVW